jgi:hypothetical protein
VLAARSTGQQTPERWKPKSRSRGRPQSELRTGRVRQRCTVAPTSSSASAVNGRCRAGPAAGPVRAPQRRRDRAGSVDFGQRIGRGDLPQARKRADNESSRDGRVGFVAPAQVGSSSALLAPSGVRSGRANSTVKRPSTACGLSDLRLRNMLADRTVRLPTKTTTHPT